MSHITLACKIPKKVVVAFSGGPDSSALLSFCQKGRREIIVLHINHGTPHAIEAEKLVKDYCEKQNLQLDLYKLADTGGHNENKWRDERLKIYKNYTSKGLTIATAHTGDDLVEWWIISSIHSKPALMKPIDEKHGLIKPFLLTPKSILIEHCIKNNVPYIIDPTNIDGNNARAILRREVIPSLLKIHPGMRTSISKLLRGKINAS